MKEKLKIAIKRTNIAYALYLNNKSYLTAKRIYNANKIIYNYLNEFLYEIECVYIDEVIEYIMHLEDWFLQFELEEQSFINLSSPFIFKRIEGGIPYPKDFIKLL
ncbi:MAG TPA: hypothetical protein DIT04_02080 [Dysgonomonas sp.]|nr:hypothetical protein [Dysgonomonas sp.]